MTADGVGAAIATNVERVLLGKREQVRIVVAALLAGGHVLIEDAPGVGKTLLAKAVARSIGGTVGRVQGTADLLPADITGVTIFDQERRDWDFRPGPLFNHVLLVDEINRATPRRSRRSSRRWPRATPQLTARSTTCPSRSSCSRPRTRSATLGRSR